MRKVFITHCIRNRKKLNNRCSKLAWILRGLGHEVRISRDIRNAAEYEDVFIFNGSLKPQKSAAKKLRDQGKNVFFLEVGYFPQAGHLMLGRHGTFGGNLFKDEVIPANTHDDEMFLQEFFDVYSGGNYRAKDDGYVLCMFQRHRDATIRQHCHPSLRTMNSLVKQVEARYPGRRIRCRRHPKEMRRKIYSPSRFTEIVPREETLLESIAGASVVVGINSTSLFEAALAGKPVVALGDCPLRDYPDRHRDVVMEVLRRQIPNNGCEDIVQRIERSIGWKAQ